MRNPFSAMADMYNSKFGKNRRKIESQRAKTAHTKKETGRSTSGGGGTAPKKVTEEKKVYNTDTYYGMLRDGGYKAHQAKGKISDKMRRRNKRKLAKRSRRINRVHRQYHKAA